MKYRKKPVVIDAIQYLREKNIHAVMDFVEKLSGEDNSKTLIYDVCSNEYVVITLEGQMLLSDGDYIIRGVKGEFYPCKPDIFELTYEKADNETVKAVQSTLDAVNRVNNMQSFANSII